MLREATRTVARAGKLARIAKARRSFAQGGDAETRERARRALVAALSDARGIPMKVAQLMATGRNDDPLASMVRGIEPWPLQRMVPTLDRSLGRPHAEVFRRVADDARAASLGQVHRAELRDGTPVAVKVQYPDIAEQVRAELRLAGLMPGLGPVKKWGFDLDGYKRVLRANMEAELDYRVEGERQRAFGDGVRVEGLVVPRVHTELSSSTVLVQSWEEGDVLDATRIAERARRFDVGRVLLETLLQSVFEHGVVHGDPHPGNTLYRMGARGRPEIVLVDYGCVVDVSRTARLALLKLILARREGTPVDVLGCFVAMGFSADRLAPIAAALPELADLLFEPFSTRGAFDVSSWRLGERVSALLGELKWWFRSAGPPELLLLLRAFQGAIRHLADLGVTLPFGAVLDRSVSEATRDAALRLELPDVEGGGTQSTSSAARLLKVKVTEHGVAQPVVELSMPAREALHLTEIVPDDVAERIRRSGLSLTATERRLREQGLEPQVLLCHQEGHKQYQVWLE